MVIDSVSFDMSNWDRDDLYLAQGRFNGRSVSVVKDNSKMKPFMHRISDVDFGYKHTNSDGRSDEFNLHLGFNNDSQSENEVINSDNETCFDEIELSNVENEATE